MIAKCLAALPTVLLLNEVHPFSELRLEPIDPTLYKPTDIVHHVSQLHNGRDPVLVLAAFCGGLEGLLSKAEPLGRAVVVRSHDHIDFFTGAIAASRCTIPDAMQERAALLRQLTVRHPLDSWLSILASGWGHHIAFATLDEFSGRCLSMLDAVGAVSTLRYEEFVLDPLGGLELICSTLCLPFDPEALQHFSEIRISGDSGRRSAAIEPRPRRALPPELLTETLDSASYQLLCNRLGYDADHEAIFPYLA